MVTTRKTKSRQAVAGKFEHWATNVLVTKCVFQYSDDVFGGKDFVSPLQFVQWNEATKRYTSSSSSVSEDDIILQAMVMLLLTQLEQGWGVETTCRQLSIWNNEKKPTQSDSLNLWEDEIQCLIDKKQLSNCTFAHIDNYASFARLYKAPKDPQKTRRLRRNADSFLGRLHVLAEQATIQWALSISTVQQKDMELLACSVIRELISINGEPGQGLALGLELCELAEHHENDFCRQALAKVFGHQL